MNAAEVITDIIDGQETVALFKGTIQAALGEVDILELDAATAGDILHAEYLEAPELDELPGELQGWIVNFAYEFGLERALITLNAVLLSFGHNVHVTGELTSASRVALTSIDMSKLTDALTAKSGELYGRFEAMGYGHAAQA